MNSNHKSILTFGLVAAVVVAFGFQMNNNNNSDSFKGQILDSETSTSVVASSKPDLSCTIEAAKSDTGDVTVDVALTNNGPGSVDGSDPFKYAIYIDNTEVFSNVDSYSTMDAGDSFSFTYPISKEIYQYADTGEVKCAIDIDSGVTEANEDNNEDTATY